MLEKGTFLTIDRRVMCSVYITDNMERNGAITIQYIDNEIIFSKLWCLCLVGR